MPRRRTSRASSSSGRALSCAALAALGFVVVTACGAADKTTDDATGTSHEAIIDGQPSSVSQDFVVQIVHPAGGGEAYVCSGSLIAPNLVLTARHCVSATPGVGFTCDQSGDGSDGGAIGADYPPSTILVFAGTFTPQNYADPNAVGAQVFHDDGANVCNHDLALLLLDRSLDGLPIATLNLDTKPITGQQITSIGWGLLANGQNPGVRQQRAGVSVITVGPGTDPSGYGVASNEFDVGESICEGDSGGPAMDASNAIVGVVSRGGNGVTAMSTNQAVSCVGPATTNFYTETAGFRDLFLTAFGAANATPHLAEVPLGESCASSGECTSNLCAVVGTEAALVCTQSCASAACPGGFRCASSDAGGALCEAAPASSGCAVTSRRGVAYQGPCDGRSGIAVVAMVVGVLARRKKRSRQ